MIFVTHLFFRRKWDSERRPRLPVRMIGYPYTSLAGAAAIVAILGTTWWVEGMRVTLIAGLPWLGVLTVAYFLVRRRPSTSELIELRTFEVSNIIESD
jgi:L-asparagine transporter-like permease